MKDMKCSGCGVCAVVCPQNCIEIRRNMDGFFRPYKEISRCTMCGLCEKVCPMENPQGKSLDKMILYSAWAKNKTIRKKSSSGGVAFCLSEQAIRKSSFVCGCALNAEKLEAEHCIEHGSEEIIKFQGSKYLQSKTVGAFQKVITILQQDAQATFLIFGTPCQIAGMKKLLECIGQSERCTLVDIFCHGVPSDLLWKKYIGMIADKMKVGRNKLSIISFRDKNYSWHNYFMHIKIGGGIDYVRSRDKDLFLKLFTMGVCNQESCFTCPYRNSSYADLRLGDYWGKRFSSIEDGVSMVLVGTEKGKMALESIADEISLIEQNINERFGQQHEDYVRPRYYEKTLEMLRDDATSLRAIVNLYESDFERLKHQIKKSVKRMLLCRW